MKWPFFDDEAALLQIRGKLTIQKMPPVSQREGIILTGISLFLLKYCILDNVCKVSTFGLKEQII